MKDEVINNDEAFRVIAKDFPFRAVLKLSRKDLDTLLYSLTGEIRGAILSKEYDYNLRAAQILIVLKSDYGKEAVRAFYDSIIRLPGSAWGVNFYNYSGISTMLADIHTSKTVTSTGVTPITPVPTATPLTEADFDKMVYGNDYEGYND